MKRILCLATALALCLTACGQKLAAASAQTQAESAAAAPAEEAAAAEQGIYALGDTVEDFTVTLADGKSVNLSELLQQKRRCAELLGHLVQCLL